MEASLEVLDATARAMQVTVPQQQVDERVQRRLRELSRKLRIDGFRPGKVPLQVVRQRHLGEVYGEVMQDLTTDSLQQALEAKGMMPVAEPAVTVQEFGEGQALKYEARFDVYPELSEAQVAQLELKDLQAAPSAEEVEAGMERLREQNRDWQAVSRPAAAADQARFDFATVEAAADGSGEPAHRSEAHTILVRPETAAEGFARELLEAFVGMSAGEEKPVPETWRKEMEPPLAAHSGPLRLRVAEVLEGRLPDWDDAEFLRRCGGATREEVRDAVQAHLEQLCAELRQQDLRVQIVAGLTVSLQPVLQVPESLRKKCLERVGELQRQLTGKVVDAVAEQEALRDARMLTAFEALRVLSGAEPTEQERQARAEAHVRQYRNPDDMRRRLQRDARLRDQIAFEAMWDALVRWVLEHAKVATQSVTLEQLQARERA